MGWMARAVRAVREARVPYTVVEVPDARWSLLVPAGYDPDSLDQLVRDVADAAREVDEQATQVAPEQEEHTQ